MPHQPNAGHMDTDTWADRTLAQVKQEVLDSVEKKYIEMVLGKTSGRVAATAKIAGIHPRGLYGKMKKLGLDKADFKQKLSQRQHDPLLSRYYR